MSDNQSNIPAKPGNAPGAAEPWRSAAFTDSRIGAMLGAGNIPPAAGSDKWPPPSPEELQGDFPQYQIRGILGCGGMSAVYHVHDVALDRDVALKVLRPALMTEECSIERFVNEARITARLDHPNIPAVYALASDGKRTSAFTMKVLEGQTLQQLLAKNEREDVDGLSAAIDVLLRICDALAFAHSKGVLHLDIKPSNVIVADYGQIYLVDWGVARRKTELPKGPGKTFAEHGTPAYMAPEQATGEHWKLDERTDIFALGGVLYRILCGRAPHAAPTAEQEFDKAANTAVTPPDPVEARKGQPLPQRLVSICMKALSADPAQRYQTVQEFQSDLDRYARGLAHLPQRTYKAGEVIVNEGEAGDAAYVVIDGDCVATRIVDGEPQELRRLKTGEVFGEVAIFAGKPRSATVRALTDTVLGFVEQAALHEGMERTSFLSLAVRTLGATFLDLERQLARQRQQSRVIELALRHVALHGERGRTPWKPLLETLTQTTGATEADVSSWVLGAPGLSIEDEALVLRG
jgi:serine/threonine-protein kinase